MSDFSIFQHVDVALSVVIGDVTVTAEQVLKLQTGTTLQLNQPVDTPVMLKFNGQIIAHGQLVAVDGHYGIQLTEIQPLQP